MARLVMLTIVLLGAVMAVPSGATNPPQAQTQTMLPTGVCSLEMKPYITQGQPVVLRFTFENDTLEPVEFDLGYDREGSFLFKLERADGVWVALPQKTVREGLSLPGKIAVAPKTRFSKQIILDEWYKFIEPGSYRVSLTVMKTPCAGPMELGFEISSTDAERLSEVCSELVDAIRKNKDNYEKAADAAKVLAKVDSPVAVPFLNKALEVNPMVGWIVIPGLDRIGDKEAIRSLISILERFSREGDEYVLARAALLRLESKSAFEEAEMIRIALARFPAP